MHSLVQNKFQKVVLLQNEDPKNFKAFIKHDQEVENVVQVTKKTSKTFKSKAYEGQLNQNDFLMQDFEGLQKLPSDNLDKNSIEKSSSNLNNSEIETEQNEEECQEIYDLQYNVFDNLSLQEKQEVKSVNYQTSLLLIKQLRDRKGLFQEYFERMEEKNNKYV